MTIHSADGNATIYKRNGEWVRSEPVSINSGEAGEEETDLEKVMSPEEIAAEEQVNQRFLLRRRAERFGEKAKGVFQRNPKQESSDNHPGWSDGNEE